MSKFKIQLKKTDFKEGELVKTEVGDKSIVLGMIKDRIYAMDSVCSHQGGPLEEGWLEDYDLTCPWHQGVFDIRTVKLLLKQIGLLILIPILSLLMRKMEKFL